MINLFYSKLRLDDKQNEVYYKMTYAECVAWLKDWTDAYEPDLCDEWDFMQWVEYEICPAMLEFIATVDDKSAAVEILRNLLYEYYTFRRQQLFDMLKPDMDAVARLPIAPQTPQKTATWHQESLNMLSGHEFGGIICGGPAEKEKAIAGKCVISAHSKAAADNAAATGGESQTVFTTPCDGKLSPFKWGWRFEPVARDVFQQHFAKGHVNDTLGRVKHTYLPRLGASPDGLIMNGPRAGRLVEIKCPISRTITGDIPERYWIQMQLQAEVCDVAAIDYIEISFGTAPFDTNHTDCLTSKLPYIGKIYVIDNFGVLSYIYSPLFDATPEGLVLCSEWCPEIPDSATIAETAIWWIRDYFETTVLRNPRWWESIGKPAYVSFWNNVDEARRTEKYKVIERFVEDDDY
jgi:hypothetical protein